MKEILDQLILEVVTLQGPTAVVAFIIFLGYALKMSSLPNKYIPLVLFVVGPILTLVMVPCPPTDPRLWWPRAAAVLTLLVIGFLLACLAWISHAKILRKFIDDKIPALNPDRTLSELKRTEVESDGTKSTKTVTEVSTAVTAQAV